MTQSPPNEQATCQTPHTLMPPFNCHAPDDGWQTTPFALTLYIMKEIDTHERPPHRMPHSSYPYLLWTLFACLTLTLVGPSEVSAAPLDTAVLRAHVLAQLRLPPTATLTVTPLHPLELPEGAQIVSLDSTLNRQFSNRTVIRVSYTAPAPANSHTIRGTVPPLRQQRGVAIAIDWQQPVWVIQRPIAAGQPLTANALKLEPRPMTHEVSHLLPPSANLAGYEARVMLRTGSLLDDRQIRQAPVVRARQPVRLILQSAPGVQIVIAGEAMNDGTVGQMVRVKHSRLKQKLYWGQVVSSGVVKVTM
jgi:flagella basal body P-ring formation protein FlgA